METQDQDCLGLFPIDFGLGSCQEILGLSKHKVARHEERAKAKTKSFNAKEPSNSRVNDEDFKSDSLPAANDYFRAAHSADYDPVTRKLLIFGGYNGPDELYVLHHADLLNSQDYSHRDKMYWEKVKVTGVKGRGGHSTFVCESRLYVYGGYNDNSVVYEDMFSIDIKSGTYETIPIEYKAATAKLNLDRRWHCSAYLSDTNKLLVHGGWNRTGALGDSLLFNMETNRWESLQLEGKAPSPRRWHSMTPLLDRSHQYLIYGGYNGDVHTPLADFHILDLEHHRWLEPQMSGKVPGRRNRHTLTPLNTNTTKEYVLIGGYEKDQLKDKNVYILHTDDMSWTCIENMGELYPAIRAAHKSVMVGTHGMVIAGGVVSDYIAPFYYVDTRMFK